MAAAMQCPYLRRANGGVCCPRTGRVCNTGRRWKVERHQHRQGLREQPRFPNQEATSEAELRCQPRCAVDNNLFVTKKRPFVCWSFLPRLAHGIIASL